jgi:acetylornithine deacetylase/succinyl-diaminopimelate desuccinylase-like protein
MSAVAAFLQQNRDRHLDQLRDLLRIPSISTQPEKRPDIERAASWIKDRLREAGCTRAEVHATEGHPIVYGEWLGAPGRPTILVYGHYDVQPVDPVDLWKTPPFEPTVKDGRVYARGASDDKGQVIVHLNALEAHLRSSGTCPVNVKFLIEGEEEIGSPHLEPFILAHSRALACDAVVVSDTAMYSKKVPSICVGLRGLAYLQVDVVGTNRDLHSGTFGGAVINPAFALVRMLAALKDDRGKIKVPGFYDKVRKLTSADRKSFATLPYNETAYRKEIGAPGLFGETGFTTLERVWARPTLEINGVWGGYTGEGAKTVIPAEAHAKISMRLVADQTPREIAKKVEAYLRKLAPKQVKVSVRHLHGGDAWLADTSHPALQAAGRAVKRAFGKAPVFTREGGSIPVVASFSRILKVPSVMMGIGLHDDNLHAPNEKIDLDNFFNGTDAAAYLMEELGAA